MNIKSENKYLWPVLFIALMAVFFGSLARFSTDYRAEQRKAANAVTSIAEIEVPAVPDVTTDRANGVVSAAEWAAYYPNEYATYMKNEDNKGAAEGRLKYTETNPDITVLYQGMGFAFDYTEAIGHSYTLYASVPSAFTSAV